MRRLLPSFWPHTAVKFNGSSTRSRTPSVQPAAGWAPYYNSTLGSFSVFARLMTTDLTNKQAVIGVGNYSSWADGYYLGVNAGKPTFQLNVGAGFSGVDAATSLTSGEWYSISATRPPLQWGANIRWMINGVRESALVASISPANEGFPSVYCGAVRDAEGGDHLEQEFTGELGRWAIWYRRHTSQCNDPCTEDDHDLSSLPLSIQRELHFGAHPLDFPEWAQYLLAHSDMESTRPKVFLGPFGAIESMFVPDLDTDGTDATLSVIDPGPRRPSRYLKEWSIFSRGTAVSAVAPAEFESTPNAAGTISAALTSAITFATAPQAAATVAPALTTSINLAMARTAQATVAAPLTTAIALALTVTSFASLDADLDLGCAAAVTAAATVDSALTTEIDLRCAPGGTATVAPALDSSIPLAQLLNAPATVQAQLATALQMAASPQAAATVAAEVETQILAASMPLAAATVAAALDSDIEMAIAPQAAATVAADLDVTIYQAVGVRFDGDADEVARTSAFSGVSDSKQGIVSFWVRIIDMSSDAFVMTHSVASADRSNVKITSAGAVRGTFVNAVSVNVFVFETPAGVIKEGQWHHVWISFDVTLSQGAGAHIYVDGVSQSGVLSWTNDTVDWTAGTWYVGRNAAGFNLALDGMLTEVYFAPGQYADGAVAANREQWRSPTGLPVALGATGSVPTGTSPALLLCGPSSQFGTNMGSGGTVTLTGALSDDILSPSDGYIAKAVYFDGANDYLTRGAALTGLTNGKTGTLSFWMKPVTPSVGTIRLWNSANNRVIVEYDTADKISLFLANSAGSTIGRYNSAPLTPGVWHHILFAWDLANATLDLYVDGVADATGPVTVTNDTIDWAQSEHYVGSSATTAAKWEGDAAQFWFGFNQYIDITSATNRAKFRRDAGTPENLGADGSVPTGTAPIVYLEGDEGKFITNAGTGGGFTENGALEDAGTSPSDPNPYTTTAVEFTSTDAVVKRDTTSGEGVADSKELTLSFWFRRKSPYQVEYVVNQLTGKGLDIVFNAGNQLLISTYTSTGGIVTRAQTTIGYADENWHHVLYAINAASFIQHVWVDDDTPGLSPNTVNDLTADFANTDFHLGNQNPQNNPFSGSLADVVVLFGQFVDTNVLANRRRLIDSQGKPVFLGHRGERAFGQVPHFLFRGDPDQFHTNPGSGGAFDAAGTISTASSSPTDGAAELGATVTAAASVSGALAVEMEADLTAAATVTAPLTTSITAAATVTAAAMGAGDLDSSIVMNCAPGGVATVTPPLETQIRLEALPLSTATVASATLDTAIVFVCGPGGVSLLTADVDTAIRLQSILNVTAVAVGSAATAVEMALTASGAATVDADLAVTSLELNADITGAAAAVAALDSEILMAAAGVAEATVTAPLSLPGQFDAMPTAAATLNADLDTAIVLASAANAAATAAAELNTTIALGATPGGAAAAGGQLTTAITMNCAPGACAFIDGTPVTGITLATTITGAGAAQGALLSEIQMALGTTASANVIALLRAPEKFEALVQALASMAGQLEGAGTVGLITDPTALSLTVIRAMDSETIERTLLSLTEDTSLQQI